MISALISRLVILVFGTLYPAYSSYKAVKTKDLKLYVKWMMYWIVFALFTAAETFTDIFFSFWFPFYYELKVIIVIWLLSPVTKGSSIMYRRVIHPLFMRREKEIDELIAKAKDQGYNVILDIGCKGMSLATNAIMNTAVKGGSGLLFQLKKSYSLNDLNMTERVDGSQNERNTCKVNDHEENFHGYEEVYETKTVNKHQDLSSGDANMRTFYEHSVVSRKTSNENIKTEKDPVAVNVRPRRSTRQDSEKLDDILKKRVLSNSVFPYNPYHSSFSPYFHLPKYNYFTPSQPASTYAKYKNCSSKYEVSSRVNKHEMVENIGNVSNSSCQMPEHCYVGCLTSNVTNTDMKRASSTPNIFTSTLAYSNNNVANIEHLPTFFCDCTIKSTAATVHKKRRKKTAPKPPGSVHQEINSNVPLVLVNGPINIDEPNKEDYQYISSREESRTAYLKPMPLLKPKRKHCKSKIQHFLSKSREFLTHWNNDGVNQEYAYSVQSDVLAASSDDSVSTTSSYNTVN